MKVGTRTISGVAHISNELTFFHFLPFLNGSGTQMGVISFNTASMIDPYQISITPIVSGIAYGAAPCGIDGSPPVIGDIQSLVHPAPAAAKSGCYSPPGRP